MVLHDTICGTCRQRLPHCTCLRDVVRRPKVHCKKCWPAPFAAVVSGEKPWEFRKNDCDYRVGDLLVLQEWEPDKGQYTGEMRAYRVTYMLDGPAFGIPDGYCIMSLKPAALEEVPPDA